MEIQEYKIKEEYNRSIAFCVIAGILITILFILTWFINIGFVAGIFAAIIIAAPHLCNVIFFKFTNKIII